MFLQQGYAYQFILLNKTGGLSVFLKHSSIPLANDFYTWCFHCLLLSY